MSALRRNARWLLAAGVVALLILGSMWWRRTDPPQYVTVAASRGPVVRAVVTTGAVNPVVTVQVGSYVSGVIQKLYCDYNTEVKAGQLCAQIDPRPYQVVVDQDAANLASAEAQRKKDLAALAVARSNYNRDLGLLKRGVVSQEAVDIDKSTLEQAIAQIGVDDAAIQQHRAALSAAQVNLGYTNIVSPVDGVVVSRSIDVGQTVAASFQTPTLFLIAKDLTKMQVDTSVSESDVGATAVGQKASFTVEAYQGRVYWGEVTQRRQAPITVQNVVTYNVVVSVDNPDLTLLPGMTANTRIITDERDDVLRVPVTALRFTPSGHKAPTAEREPESRRANGGDTTTSTGAPRGEERRRGAGAGKHGAQHVWVLRDNEPVAVTVTTGLNDSTYAEITGGDLQADDRVIVNEIQPGADQRPRTTTGAPPGRMRPF